MSDDLLERFRALVPHCEDPSDYSEDDRTILEVASALQLLQSDNVDGHVFVNSVAGRLGLDWHDEFLAFYKPEEWFGSHRAGAAFVAGKMEELRQEIERVKGALEEITNVPYTPDAGGLGIQRNEMIRIARAALSTSGPDGPRQSSIAEAVPPEAWPNGCIKPNACSRHRMCVYAMTIEQCRHVGRNIGPEVTAEKARRLALQTGGEP